MSGPLSIAFYFLLALGVVLDSCLPVSAQSALTYVYGTPYAETGNSLVADGDSKFYLFGSSKAATNGALACPLLVHTDTSGRILSTKEYRGASDNSEGINMVRADSSLYLFSSALHNGRMHVVFMRTRLDGVILWQRSYATEFTSNFICSPLHRDLNGDWIVHVLGDFLTSNVLRFSSDGRLLQRLGLSTGDVPQIFDAIPALGGGLLVCGNRSNNAFLMKVDATGHRIWHTTIGSGSLFRGGSLMQLPGGNIIMNGYAFISTRYHMLICFSPTGQVLWQRYFKRLSPSGEELHGLAGGIIRDTDGNILAQGVCSNGLSTPNNPTQDADIFKFDTLGNFQWSTTIASNDYDVAGIVQTPLVGGMYASTASTRGAAGGTQDYDMGLIRYRPGTSNGCVATASIRFFTFSDIQIAADTASLSRLTLFDTAALSFTPVNRGLCRRKLCQPQLNIWDSLGPDQRACPGRLRFPQQLDAGNIYASYRWSTGDTTRLVSISTPGTYWVQITNSCGSFTDTIHLQELPMPVPILDSSGPLRFCAGGQVRLRVHGLLPGATHIWSTGASDTTLLVRQSGLYSLTSTSQEGCTGYSDTLNIRVDPLPAKPRLLPQVLVNLCPGDTATIRIQTLASGDTLLWNNGSLGTDSIRVNTAGMYWVQATNRFRCRINSDTIRVQELPIGPPTAATPLAATQFCQGDSVILLALGQSPIKWNNGHTGSRLVVYESGQYWARGTATPCPAQPSDTILVRVNSLPIADAGPALELCQGDTAYLGTPGSDDQTYRWTILSGAPFSNTAQPLLTDVQPFGSADSLTHQTFVLTVRSQAGCMARDTTIVSVHGRYELSPSGVPYCATAPLLIPNLISPNGDNLNDRFEVKALANYRESSLEIFNRYGMPVFKASPYRNDWDGGDLPAGTYYYHLQIPKMGRVFKGWVELVK